MSNVLEFEARSSVERQAREWLIRLDADEPLTSAERQALHEWMARSPVHGAELTRLSKFWREANVLTELAVPLVRNERPQTDRRRWRLRATAAIASFVIASVTLGAWWIHRQIGAGNGIYGTTIGEQRVIALEDGSSIQLNTDSQVRVAYADAHRRIELLRGEALFSVTHDAHRAFEVYAANGIVRAVGTAFSVHVQGSDVNVTVTQGVVSLAEIGSVPRIGNVDSVEHVVTPRIIGRLEAGQTTTFGNSTSRLDVRRLAAPELRRRLAWREGYLTFSGEPLSVVVDEVNRYSPVTLTIADPALASISVGARFRIGDLDGVLDVLREEFSIESTRVGERHILLSQAPSR